MKKVKIQNLPVSVTSQQEITARLSDGGVLPKVITNKDLDSVLLSIQSKIGSGEAQTLINTAINNLLGGVGTDADTLAELKGLVISLQNLETADKNGIMTLIGQIQSWCGSYESRIVALTANKAEKTELTSAVSAINSEFRSSVNNLANSKADKTELAGKVNQADLASKADKTELASVRQELGGYINQKSDKSELTTAVMNLQTAINEKQSSAQVQIAVNALETKLLAGIGTDKDTLKEIVDYINQVQSMLANNEHADVNAILLELSQKVEKSSILTQALANLGLIPHVFVGTTDYGATLEKHIYNGIAFLVEIDQSNINAFLPRGINYLQGCNATVQQGVNISDIGLEETDWGGRSIPSNFPMEIAGYTRALKPDNAVFYERNSSLYGIELLKQSNINDTSLFSSIFLKHVFEAIKVDFARINILLNRKANVIDLNSKLNKSIFDEIFVPSNNIQFEVGNGLGTVTSYNINQGIGFGTDVGIAGTLATNSLRIGDLRNSAKDVSNVDMNSDIDNDAFLSIMLCNTEEGFVRKMTMSEFNVFLATGYASAVAGRLDAQAYDITTLKQQMAEVLGMTENA